MWCDCVCLWTSRGEILIFGEVDYSCSCCCGTSAAAAAAADGGGGGCSRRSEGLGNINVVFQEGRPTEDGTKVMEDPEEKTGCIWKRCLAYLSWTACQLQVGFPSLSVATTLQTPGLTSRGMFAIPVPHLQLLSFHAECLPSTASKVILDST